MSDLQAKVTELAEWMVEFGLEEARFGGDGWLIELGRNPPRGGLVAPVAAVAPPARKKPAPKREPAVVEAPPGTPISSPMTGIFYTSPSPQAPPFVLEGDSVTKGQVVGLIEAMKVFNEIVAPTVGVVSKVVAQNGQLVQPGEPLLYLD